MRLNDECRVGITGIGWFLAGVISSVFGFFDLGRICDCSAVLAKVNASSYTFCVCPNGMGFLLTGVSTCIIGLLIIMMRQKIVRFRKKMLSRNRRPNQ